MEIILIPCCKRKVTGGDQDFKLTGLADVLNTATYSCLMEARLDLAKHLGLQPGPDLGFREKSGDINYLPAYQRYDGVIYRTGDVRNRFNGYKGRIIILSALYGLLEASDLIRNYDLAMNDSLPLRLRVSNFWKQHRLHKIIEEYYHSWGSATLHDLLSNTYRKSLDPWPTPKITHYQRYDYPGLQTASNYPRGEDLRRLIVS